MIGLTHPNQGGQASLPQIVPLEVSDVSRIRFGWSSRFDTDGLAQVVRAYPGLSLWVPDTGEYVVGGPWRHRSEIVGVIELAATGNAARLLRSLASAASTLRHRLVIASEHHEARTRAFYDVAGFELIENILIYELPRVRAAPPGATDLRFELVSVDDEDALQELLELDHAAFPWLWWNSREEFDNYGHSPGVEIWIGRDRRGAAVSYVGVTRYRSWGHLDRIAVKPEFQGRGFGLQSLEWAVYILGRGGARRVGLSTQARNDASRRLYERYGFRRVMSQDYALYGRWLEAGGRV